MLLTSTFSFPESKGKPDPFWQGLVSSLCLHRESLLASRFFLGLLLLQPDPSSYGVLIPDFFLLSHRSARQNAFYCLAGLFADLNRTADRPFYSPSRSDTELRPDLQKKHELFAPSSRETLKWPCVGKYEVDIASFDTIAIPELEVKEGTDLFVIDEVGKMELLSSLFFPAVLKVLHSNIPLLATIPIPKYGRDIPEVSTLRNYPGAMLSTLNTGNRDAIRETICNQIVNMLEKH